MRNLKLRSSIRPLLALAGRTGLYSLLILAVTFAPWRPSDFGAPGSAFEPWTWSTAQAEDYTVEQFFADGFGYRGSQMPEILEVCGDVVDESGEVATDSSYKTYYEKKITYCGAAVNADKAVGYLEGVSYFYIALFAVCLTAAIICVATSGPQATVLVPIGQAFALACSIGGALAAVADGIWNAAVQSSFSSTATQVANGLSMGTGIISGAAMLIGGAGMGFTQAVQASDDGATQAADAACSTATAVFLFGTSFLHLLTYIAKRKGAVDAAKSIESNLDGARTFNADIKSANTEVTAFEANAGAKRGARGMNGGGKGGGKKRGDEAEGGRCSGAGSESLCVDETGSAATAGNSFVNRPDVNDAFKRAKGMDARSFLNSTASSSPSGAASAAMAGLLTGETAASLIGLAEQGLKDNASELAAAAGSTFQGGGGRSRSGGGGSGGPDLAGMMEGLMGQLGGKKDGKEGESNVIDFGAKIAGKTHDQIFEDKTISLFQRIDFRYKSNLRGNNVESLPWAVQYNQVTAGSAGRAAGAPAAAPKRK
ncbi:MAG: hypothetical protein IT285_04565 [Bdellovibrionales bacterium]|nr:hypothetical protein [Bdellovibrionales bacterium]